MFRLLLHLTYVGLLWLPHLGYGCKCDKTSSVRAEYQAVDLVVYGRIKGTRFKPWADTQTVNLLEGAWLLKNIERLPPHPHIWGATRVVTIEVLRGFKGAKQGDIITIFTSASVAACGYSFTDIGKNFIIYGIRDSFDRSKTIRVRLPRPYTLDTFWTSRCSRTKPYFMAEIAALEKIQPGNR